MSELYKKPLVFLNEDLAEGIYAASGGGGESGTGGEGGGPENVAPGGPGYGPENKVWSSGSGADCYTTSIYFHQWPETGRGTYKMQFDSVHAASHSTDNEVLVIVFDQPVTYVSGGTQYKAGSGTSTLEVQFYHHNNGTDNIGDGSIEVSADSTLHIVDVYMICNHN